MITHTTRAASTGLAGRFFPNLTSQGVNWHLLGLQKHNLIYPYNLNSKEAKVLWGLTAKGFKVVHLVPKAPVATLAGFAGKATPGAIERSKAATAVPLVQRPAVGPAATPGKPVETFQVKATPPLPAAPQPITGQAAAAHGADGPDAKPGAAQIVGAPPAPQVPPPAPRLRGTTDEDWRRRIFNN